MKTAIRLWRQYKLPPIAANHAISNSQPTLGTPDLLDRLVDGCFLPPIPTHSVASVTKLDLLHRDDDDVGPAHHQAIAQFFPAFADWVWVRPQAHEAVRAQRVDQAFGRSEASAHKLVK